MKILTLALAILSISSLSSNAADYPAFINNSANHIELNGTDLSSLKSKLSGLRQGNDDIVKILHIGDSHIQAEFVTNHLRDKLQTLYGNAGRGLITPLRLAGTNQPVDYSITSPIDKKHWRQTRLLKYPWQDQPGITGIAAIPEINTTVTWKATLPGHNIKDAKFITSSGVDEITFAAPVDSISIPVHAGQAIYGAILTNGQPGILYSAIGNNGACYTDYSLISNFAADTRQFDADLIILSMGTNEGFSTMTDQAIKRSVDDLIKTIRNYNPGVPILVLLPMECQKNRNHGHKPLSPYYDINDRVAQAKDIIADAARDQGVMVWDFYTVAGGHGASDKWLENKLMNKDRIHLVKSGYTLMGDLLYDALLEIF